MPHLFDRSEIITLMEALILATDVTQNKMYMNQFEVSGVIIRTYFVMLPSVCVLTRAKHTSPSLKGMIH